MRVAAVRDMFLPYAVGPSHPDFSSLADGRHGRDQRRLLGSPTARGPSSQRRKTHSSGTVNLSQITSPTHSQAKGPNEEGPGSAPTHSLEEYRARGPWLGSLSLAQSLLSFLLLLSLSLFSLSVYVSPPSFSFLVQVFLSPFPLFASLNLRHSCSVSPPLWFFSSLSAFLPPLPPSTF